jgi:hypothetical protein
MVALQWTRLTLSTAAMAIRAVVHTARQSLELFYQHNWGRLLEKAFS